MRSWLRRLLIAVAAAVILLAASVVLIANAHRFKGTHRAVQLLLGFVIGGADSLDLVWGPMCRTMVRVGDFFVVGEGMNVVSLRLGEGGRLHRVHSVRVGSSVHSLKGKGNTLYAAAGGEGVVALNVSPSGKIKVTHRDPEAGYALSLFHHGDRLFSVGKEGAGLRIYDMTTPKKPKLRGVYGKGGGMSSVLAWDRFAAVAGEGRLEILDVDSISAPRLIATLDVPAPAGVHGTDPVPRSIARQGSILLMANGSEGVWFVETADPSQPRVIQRINDGDYYDSVHVDGTTAYLGRRAKGPLIVNFSDPRHLVTLAEIADSGLPVGIADEHLYIARATKGMRIYRIGAGAPPALLASYEPPSFAYSVAVESGVAYVPSGGGGVRIYDLRNPRHPLPAGTLETPGHAHSVKVIGGRLWICDVIGGLHEADISDPTHPRILQTVHKGNHPWDLAPTADGHWLLADGQHGMTLWDPSAKPPAGVAEAPAEGYALAVASAGDFAYLATIGNWVHLIRTTRLPLMDLGQLPWPKMGPLPIPAPALALHVHGNRLFIGNALGQVMIFDVSKPDHPALLGRAKTGAPVFGLSVSDSSVWAAAGKKGVVRIDVTNPTKPKILRRIRVQGTAMGLAVSDGIVYVAAGEAGLQTADIDSDDNR